MNETSARRPTTAPRRGLPVAMALVAIAGAALALPALAQNAATPAPANSGAPAGAYLNDTSASLSAAQIDTENAFHTADANHDGKLDPAEFATLPKAIRDHAVDANGDGFYTLAETTNTANGLVVFVPECGFGRTTEKLLWADTPTLDPDEIALEIDAKSARPGSAWNTQTFDVKRVLAGSFKNKSVTVDLPCGDLAGGAPGADILVGKLDSRTGVLAARMPPPGGVLPR